MSSYDIIHEEETFLAVNKPAGMPTQADKSQDVSLKEQLARDLGGEVFVVHRLDRPASGLVLFARDKPMAASLSEMLRDHKIERVYWAIVNRAPEPTSGTLSHMIRVDSRTNKSHIVKKGGKHAVLTYSTIGESERYTLLEVRLDTGRHHQIRAQLQAIGFPIRGDLKYGAKRSQRGGGIGLHAARLAFAHPDTGSPIHLVAPPPDESLWTALTQSLNGDSVSDSSPDVASR